MVDSDEKEMTCTSPSALIQVYPRRLQNGI
jgi:hypothetical protein